MKYMHGIQWIFHLVKYNLKIIFAGKFAWFLLAAFLIFGYFMFQSAWNRTEINEALIYDILLFPCILLVFYPAVFGIQNDEDSRILEILFGIPDYKYKVWATRLLIIYTVVFFLLVLFAAAASVLMYPLNPAGMALQLMFPVWFAGNLAFLFSTIIRNGNGTAVIVIILCIAWFILGKTDWIAHICWDILLNPYASPENTPPALWQNTLLKNRIFLLTGSIVWILAGLSNLQRREKFV